MGNRRMGLGRMEALLEAVDRDLNLVNSTLTNCAITTSAACSFQLEHLVVKRTVLAKTANYTVLEADSGKIIQVNPAGTTLIQLSRSRRCGRRLEACTVRSSTEDVRWRRWTRLSISGTNMHGEFFNGHYCWW